MAPMTPPSSPYDSLAPSQATEEAVQRVTLYFQSLGLPQEPAAHAAEKIVSRCQVKWTNAGGELIGRAMDQAIDRVAAWFDQLAATTGAPSPGARAQLGWYLRPQLRIHPEAFLASRDLPEDFHHAVEIACKPMLPLLAPRMMPPQSLWQLPHFWQRVIAYAYLMWYRLRTMRWLGRT